MDFFKNMFGFRNRGDDSFDDSRFNQFWEEERRDFRGPPPEEHDGMGFNIFTNPLEMHRYFEQQMNEFLKQFQMEDHGSFGGSFFGGGTPEFPMLDEKSQEQPPSGSLRDQYIKPGYEKSGGGAGSSAKVDTDLDEKFRLGDLDAVLKKPEGSMVPFQQKPEMRVFGQSVQYKTVRNPDGSVETQKIVRDNSGNEERTVTRKFGDKEHTITIKRDREGREERTENLINMDNNEASQIWGNQQGRERQNLPRLEDGSGQDGILSSLFSKFFK